MGRHAQRSGRWFNAFPWVILAATLLFLVLYLRHLPCVQTDANNQINSYIRLCYSDIQSTFMGQGFGLGNSALAGEHMLFPPLVAVAMVAATQASRLFGSVGPTATLQQQVDASAAFFGLTALGLFVCFLIAVVSIAFMGRVQGRNRAWDAMVLAASPIVLAAGLISWDLLPLAFTALGLLQFARGRLFEAGVVLGLAACAGTMPIAVVLAVVVATGLRGGAGRAALVGGAAVVTFFAVHLPLLLDNFDRVYSFYYSEIHKETSYGSFWYLIELGGFRIRHSGSLGFMVLVLALGVFFAYLYVARKRPRVGSVVGVVILLTVVLGASFTPQTSLWVLLAVILARPFKPELIAVTITQVAHTAAIWGWLSGALTSNQQGPYFLYWLAIIAHVAVEVWVLLESVLDILDPGRDSLRAPDLPDPIGGSLNRGEEAVPLEEPAHAA